MYWFKCVVLFYVFNAVLCIVLYQQTNTISCKPPGAVEAPYLLVLCANL